MSAACLFGLDSVSAVVPLLPGALCSAGNEVVKVMFIVISAVLSVIILYHGCQCHAFEASRFDVLGLTVARFCFGSILFSSP